MEWRVVDESAILEPRSTSRPGMRMTTLTLYGIRNCGTVRKARGWLDAQRIGYVFHDYRLSGIDRARLERWCAASGWETVFNRAGTSFRRLPEADKVGLDESKALALMLELPSMIKRPVLERGTGRGALLVVGFSPERYAAALKSTATSGPTPRRYHHAFETACAGGQPGTGRDSFTSVDADDGRDGHGCAECRDAHGHAELSTAARQPHWHQLCECTHEEELQ